VSADIDIDIDTDIDIDIDEIDIENTYLDRNAPFSVSHSTSLPLERSVLFGTEVQM